MDEDGLLTALPGSMDPETGRWRVTAFVTPRLDPGGDQVELAEFPGFADWGEISGQFRLGLEFDSPGSSAPWISNPTRARRDPIPRCGGRCSPTSGSAAGSSRT